MQGAVPELDDRGILKSLSELVLTVLGNANNQHSTEWAQRVYSRSSGELLVVLGGRETLLGSGCGNKDLVSLEVASGSVVLTVLKLSDRLAYVSNATTYGDPPRVVRNKEQRVQDPSDRVVDLLGRRERLVSAFVAGSSAGSCVW